MTLQQAAGYQNRKDIPPQQAAGNYQVKMSKIFGSFSTRFSIYLWCGLGFLFVALRNILVNGYNHRAGFMIMLGLALLAAAFTDRKKSEIRAWQEEKRKSQEGTLKK